MSTDVEGSVNIHNFVHMLIQNSKFSIQHS